MTIAALLSHLAVHVPRYVTVDGRVLAGTVPEGVTGTQVKPTRFHGGPDPAVADGTSWWIADPDSVMADMNDMTARFPTFSVTRDQRRYVWDGVINTGRGTFPISMTHHPDRSLPTIAIPGRRLGRSSRGLWRESPHTYLSGAICVADPKDWDSATDLSSTGVAWAAHWLAAYTQWHISGTWPTAGHERVPR